MGKSYKERPDKWRRQLNQKKNKNRPRKQEWERIVDTLADEYDQNPYNYKLDN